MLYLLNLHFNLPSSRLYTEQINNMAIKSNQNTFDYILHVKYDAPFFIETKLVRADSTNIQTI